MFNEAIFREIFLPKSSNVNATYVLCQMGHPLRSSIYTLFFLSIAVPFTNTCPRTQNKENDPGHRARRKRNARLGNIGSSSNKKVK